MQSVRRPSIGPGRSCWSAQAGPRRNVYVANGVAILASRRLPAWIGWVGLVLGVASVTPAAIAGFFGLVLWPPVVGILTYLRSSRPETAGAVVEPAPA
jgi:hypothetical protein